VKARDADGTVSTVLCDTPEQASSDIAALRALGYEVWVEDENGRRINETHFTNTPEQK
jgi:hypothetical protein